jgi:hypothetical protein
MDGIELLASLVLCMIVGVIGGYSISQLINPSYDTGVNTTWAKCQIMFDSYNIALDKAKVIVDDCADKAMIVIDERDACQKALHSLDKENAICQARRSDAYGFN